MNLRTEISLLGRLSIEAVLLTVYSSQPQRAFSSKSSLHNYRPLRFSRCSHAQQKVLLSSFSASDNVLVTYVLTVKRRGCQIFSTLRSGGPLADGRQVGLDRAPDPGSGHFTYNLRHVHHMHRTTAYLAPIHAPTVSGVAIVAYICTHRCDSSVWFTHREL